MRGTVIIRKDRDKNGISLAHVYEAKIKEIPGDGVRTEVTVFALQKLTVSRDNG